MFLQSQIEKCEQMGIVKMPEQDEDVDTDEELLGKNQEQVLEFLKESMADFCGQNGKKISKKDKKMLVRNF